MSEPEFTVIIPARYGSTRFPGKPLAELAGRPMLAHVFDRARESGAARVIVATDDARIADAAAAIGAEVAMTRADHRSGTDRLAEVVEQQGLKDSAIVVNLQGDEPLMAPALIRQTALALVQRPDTDISTLATPIAGREEVFDPNAVKVVRDRQGYALYFSRAPIPWDREQFKRPDAALAAGYLRHLGIYGYRVSFLRRYPQLAEVELERVEALEQLRALWDGARIYVGIADGVPGPGVDTPEDLDKVAGLLAARSGP